MKFSISNNNNNYYYNNDINHNDIYTHNDASKILCQINHYNNIIITYKEILETIV